MESPLAGRGQKNGKGVKIRTSDTTSWKGERQKVKGESDSIISNIFLYETHMFFQAQTRMKIVFLTMWVPCDH
jgi:hypothetical protein